MMNVFLRYIELILSAAGLLVIVAVPTLLPNLAGTPWKTAAITAVTVGVLHGLIFFAVRSRQRRIRHDTIREIAAMLSEVVNNQLSIMTMLSEHADTNPKKKAEMTLASAHKISAMLAGLNHEALRRWQTRFTS